MYEVFPVHVDTSSIPIVPDSPAKKNAKPLKSWSEISSLIQAGRKRDVGIFKDFSSCVLKVILLFVAS